MSNGYNLTHFEESAISYQFDIAKIPDVQLSSLVISIQTGGSAYGGFEILYVKEKTGEIILGSRPFVAEDEVVDYDAPPTEDQIVVGNVNEEGFSTVRVTVDFEAAKIIAYGADGEELGSIDIAEVPTGVNGQLGSMLEWQHNASPYIFYASIVRGDESVENSGILFYNLVIIEGRAF
jgi:hypothetical protein